MTDKYFGRKYDAKNYNCAHFVCDVWQDETGKDIRQAMGGFLAGRGDRRAILADLRAFKRLQAPQSPCIALFQSPRQAPHVGIFLRGRVLHISKEQGVRFDRMEYAALGAKKIGFYTC